MSAGHRNLGAHVAEATRSAGRSRGWRLPSAGECVACVGFALFFFTCLLFATVFQ